MKSIQQGIVSALVDALRIGCAIGLLAPPALAQDVKVEVTGTNIRRVDVETVAPVQIITREEITRTGMPTIAEVLRTLPANSGSYGESFTNSFAPGASAISLRGLGQKATLVLLNGRRVSGYGFAQNISDTFVDLNAIPSSAVERVEILQDGASAIYGSDAIAGVVNIILRREFKGIEVQGALGGFEGKHDYKATLTAGVGDLAKDKYNVFGTFDYYKRDNVLFSDTKFGESRDWRGRTDGGRNLRSLTTGGTWRQLTATGGLSNTYRAISGCEGTGGTVLNGQQAAAAGLINLTPPTPGVPGGQSQAAYDTNLAMAAETNTFCSRDINNALSAIPETERIGFLGRGTWDLSPTVSAYAEAAYSHITTFQVFTAPFFAGSTGLIPTPAGLQPFAYNLNFAPGVSGNPFSSNARFLGSLWDTGTRDTDITSDTWRVLGGLKYVLGGWDLDSGAGYSKNEVDSLSINRLSFSGVAAVFGVPAVAQPPVPLVTSTSYSVDNPLTNSASVRNQIRFDVPRKSESELFFIDTKASTEIKPWKLPGGYVGVAVGGEYRDEKLKDIPDPRAANGDVLGQGITATEGKRNNFSAYGELALPIFKELEGQLAARYDHYSDYGNSTTPKVGFKWTPIRELLFRANWGKGFRAPTLPEISKSLATSFQQIIDPEDGLIRNVSGVSLGNPDLKAEKSTNTLVGVVFEPVQNFSIALDGYWIDWKDVVVRPSSQDVVNASCPNGGPGCPSTPDVIRDPSNNNAVVTVYRQYRNQNNVKTNGLDLDARWRIPTSAYGRYTLRTVWTYVDSFKEEGVEHAGTNDGTNTYPRVRGLFAVDFDYGPWAVTARMNYTHGYHQKLLPASYFAVQNPEFQSGTYPERIPNHTTYDLYGSYSINKNWSVSAAVLNVTDKVPPFDPGFDATGLYDFQTYDVRGRQWRVSFTYAM